MTEQEIFSEEQGSCLLKGTAKYFVESDSSLEFRNEVELPKVLLRKKPCGTVEAYAIIAALAD